MEEKQQTAQGGRHARWPKVSVVLSTHNRPEKLQKMVYSILNQDTNDFELLVVDDGSNTAKKALEFLSPKFEAKGIPMVIIELEDCSGYQSRPKNIGIAYSNGSYIAHADDDDQWYPWHLSTLVGLIERGGADVVYGTFDFGGEREGESWEYIPFNHLTQQLILAHPTLSFISCYTLYSKASAISALGWKLWDEDVRRFGDWNLYHRMIQAGLRFKGIDKATFKYMWHGENLQITRPMNEGTAKATRTEEGPSWDRQEVGL